MRFLPVIAAIAMALPLAACGGGREMDQLRGTPEYQAGYNDGCASGSAQSMRGPSARNDALYDTSRAYRSGWASGYSLCRPPVPGPLQTGVPGAR